MDSTLSVILTASLGIFASIISYILGREAKVDTVMLNKGLPLIEDVVKLFQDIVETEQYYRDFYERVFGHVTNIEEAMNSFEEHTGLYEREYEAISAHMNNRGLLKEKLKVARIYLKSDITKRLQEYLNLGLFVYQHGGGGIDYNYYLGFFNNILDEQKAQERKKIYGEVQRKLDKVLHW